MVAGVETMQRLHADEAPVVVRRPGAPDRPGRWRADSPASARRFRQIRGSRPASAPGRARRARSTRYRPCVRASSVWIITADHYEPDGIRRSERRGVGSQRGAVPRRHRQPPGHAARPRPRRRRRTIASVHGAVCARSRRTRSRRRHVQLSVHGRAAEVSRSRAGARGRLPSRRVGRRGTPARARRAFVDRWQIDGWADGHASGRGAGVVAERRSGPRRRDRARLPAQGRARTIACRTCSGSPSRPSSSRARATASADRTTSRRPSPDIRIRSRYTRCRPATTRSPYRSRAGEPRNKPTGRSGTQ